MNANFQLAILYNVDAVIQLPWTEDVFSFMQLQKKHVLAQFQEERLFKVTKNPSGKGEKKNTVTHCAAKGNLKLFGYMEKIAQPNTIKLWYWGNYDLTDKYDVHQIPQA